MAPTPPDPSKIIDGLKGMGRAPSSVTKDFMHDPTVRDYVNSPAGMQVAYGIEPINMIGADLLIDHPLKSTFSAVPIAASTSEYFEAVAVHETESDQYYDRAGTGYFYENKAGLGAPGEPRLLEEEEGEPAALTEVPTSSVNPQRPRTVAAGYDKHRKTLTVVFRDGTFYNYYEVTNLQWQNFKKAYSKGEYILAYLDSHPRGIADVSHLTGGQRETLYRLARTGQIMRKGLTDHQKSVAKQTKIRNAQIKRAAAKRAGGATHATYKPGNLGGTGRKRAKGK